jgi:hypothetical protein
MLQTVTHLKNLGWDTVDFTFKGWTASTVGNSQMLAKLQAEDLTGNPVMIFNLLSNFVHRYRQCDDTLSLPYKANGKFHMAGNVTMVSDQVLKKDGRVCHPNRQQLSVCY